MGLRQLLVPPPHLLRLPLPRRQLPQQQLRPLIRLAPLLLLSYGRQHHPDQRGAVEASGVAEVVKVGGQVVAEALPGGGLGKIRFAPRFSNIQSLFFDNREFNNLHSTFYIIF